MLEEWVVRLREGHGPAYLKEAARRLGLGNQKFEFHMCVELPDYPLARDWMRWYTSPEKGERSGGRTRHADITGTVVGQACGVEGHLSFVDPPRPPLSLVEWNVGWRGRTPKWRSRRAEEPAGTVAEWRAQRARSVNRRNAWEG